MLRMEQVHVIRHKVLREGQSVRQVARELGVSRNTIGKYLREAEPIRTRQSCVRQVQQKGSWVCGRREAAGAERSPLGRARRSARGGLRQLAAW